MAYFPTIDHLLRRTTTFFEDELSAKHFAECAKRCHHRHSLPYTHLILVNALITIGSNDITWLSKRLRAIAGDERIGSIAVVAAGTVDFGLLRMLSTMVSDVCEISVHRSCGNAIAHLQWSPADSLPTDLSAGEDASPVPRQSSPGFPFGRQTSS